MVRKVQVTVVYVSNTETGETFNVPGMRFSRDELRDLVRHAPTTGVAQVYCDECNESVADCTEVRNSLPCPAAWSYKSETPQGVYLASDALVMFNV